MRVLVFGGRHFNDVQWLWRVLDLQLREAHIFTLIDGASDDVTGPYVGADYWAHQWACARDIGTLRFHAEWKKLGKAAGPIRNRRMRDEGKPDLGIGFPGGRGTAGMAALLTEASIPIKLLSIAKEQPK